MKPMLCMASFSGLRQTRYVEPLGAQLRYRLLHDLLVCLDAYVGYEAALLGSQQIARTAYVEVLHGNVEARAQIGELLYCPSGGGASLRLTARWAG